MMDIRTVSQHHEVLRHWAGFREAFPAAPAVLSLDFHTDTLSCLRRGIADPQTPDEAVKCLHHDEHFDWALRHDIISRAVIISIAPCAEVPEHPALEVIRDPRLPGVNEILNFPDTFREAAAMMLDDRFLAPLLPENFPAKPYILDIDCDYFLSRLSLAPEEGQLIRRLAAGAVAVTLSEENEWVNILRLPGEDISGSFIAGELVKFFG